jgi:tetratricopeptide (TPR) repeat protein
MPRSLLATIVLTALLAGPLAARSAEAQPRCTEPDDAVYLEHMQGFTQAVNDGEFETVLALTEWAIEHYRYATHRYARARALHRLGRYDESAREYTAFLEVFAGCADPEGLADRARAFRAEVSEAAEAERRAALPPDDPTEPQGLPPGTWVAIAGGAVLASGVIFDLANLDLIEERDAARASGEAARISAANSSLGTARTIDWVLYGVGGATLAVGLVWLALDGGGDEGTGEPGSLAPFVGAGTVGVSGRF